MVHTFVSPSSDDSDKLSVRACICVCVHVKVYVFIVYMQATLRQSRVALLGA